MKFKNVNTYENMVKDGEEMAFHQRYEGSLRGIEEIIKANPPYYHNIIEGKRIEGKRTFTNVSPIDTDLVLGKVAMASEEEVSKALRAAERAYVTWSAIDLGKRLRIFKKAAEIMRKELFDIAAMITLDNGKNRYEAVAEVDEAIDFITYYTESMEMHDGFREEKLAPYGDEHPISVMRPYGIWAVICPFNFPMAISTGMVTGAIITGNTAVMKPSSPSPMPVYHILDVYERAGLPPGVINILAGSGAEIGNRLVNDEKIDGVVFTGSKDVGYSMLANSLRRYPIPVITEMGGKNPCIVSDKADLKGAVSGVISSAFGYSGQKCSACSRVYLHDNVFDEFMVSLIKGVQRLKVGDPREKGTYMGPVIHEKAVKDFQRYVEMAKKDGLVQTGGGRITDGDMARGHYVEPTVVTSLPEEHHMVKNELFLPILCVQTFTDIKDAVHRANDVDFGLTSGIFTDDEDEMNYFFENIQAGVSYANRVRGATTGAMVGGQPFGGWKASGSTGIGTGTDIYLLQFMRQQSRTIVG